MGWFPALLRKRLYSLFIIAEGIHLLWFFLFLVGRTCYKKILRDNTETSNRIHFDFHRKAVAGPHSQYATLKSVTRTLTCLLYIESTVEKKTRENRRKSCSSDTGIPQSLSRLLAHENEQKLSFFLCSLLRAHLFLWNQNRRLEKHHPLINKEVYMKASSPRGAHLKLSVLGGPLRVNIFVLKMNKVTLCDQIWRSSLEDD